MKKGLLILGAGAAALYLASKKKKAEKPAEDKPADTPSPSPQPKPQPEYIVEDGEIIIPDNELAENYDDTWRLMQKALLDLGYNVPTNGYLNDKATQEGLIHFKWDANTVGYYASSVWNPTPSLSQDDWIELMKSMPDSMVFGLAVDLSIDAPTAQAVSWARDKSPIKWRGLVQEARDGLKKYVKLEDLAPPPSPSSEDPELPDNYWEIDAHQIKDTIEVLNEESRDVAYVVYSHALPPTDFRAQLMSFANHSQENAVINVIDEMQPSGRYSLDAVSVKTGASAVTLKNQAAKTILYWMQKFENEHIVDEDHNAKLPGEDEGGSALSNIKTFLADAASDVIDAIKGSFNEAYIFTHQDDMPGELMMAIKDFAKENPNVFVGIEDCQGEETDRCGKGLYGLQVVDLQNNQPIKTFNQIKGETAISLADKYVSEGI